MQGHHIQLNRPIGLSFYGTLYYFAVDVHCVCKVVYKLYLTFLCIVLCTAQHWKNKVAKTITVNKHNYLSCQQECLIIAWEPN